MKFFRRTAGILTTVLTVAFLFGGVAFAGYEIDDLEGDTSPSQWMVVNESYETFGGKYNDDINVSSDALSSTPAVVNILTGKAITDDRDDEAITNRVPRVLFLVLTEGYGEFSMNYKAEDLLFDVSTPNLGLSTFIRDSKLNYSDYKTVEKAPDELGSDWNRFRFEIVRNGSQNVYDTLDQPFTFHQNPNDYASQTIDVPFLISNVSSLTAKEEPLIVRNILRESSNKGNIVAYNHDAWFLTGDKSVNNTQWVFVPDSTAVVNNDIRNFYLTTEVVNHSSNRYQQSTEIPESYRYPQYWKFDFKPRQGTTYGVDSFQIAKSSHIAPGLVSVFRRKFNITEWNKIPLRLLPTDASQIGGPYNFVLNHNLIGGVSLCQDVKKAPQGNFNLFEVTAFKPAPLSNNFYDEIKAVTGAQGTVEAPDNAWFTATQNEDTPGIKSLTNFFTIEQSISGNSSSTEKILPLHITFNIPVTLVDDGEWLNKLVQQWYDTGDIEGIFSNKYHIYLLAETDGSPNPWDLTKHLQDKGIEHSQLKIFYDSERGQRSYDNTKSLITVSFIAMLMDGTRDGRRPELSIVRDQSGARENDYIVIRDGNRDNKWKMTFVIAPEDYFDNPSSSAAGMNANDENLDESGSSGTCNSISLCGSGISLVILLALKRRERR